MHRPITALLALGFLAACGSEGGVGSGAAATRDSAGIAIVEYPGSAMDAAPAWSLSATPLATIGGGASDTALDLSRSQIAAVLDDGRVLAANLVPPQIYVFRPDGSQQGTLGRGGEGPGEYRMISNLLPLAADTVAAYDLFQRNALLFHPDGAALGNIQFPTGGATIPPLLVARINGGTWIFQVVNPMSQPPAGADGAYRVDEPVYSWRDGMPALDTLFLLPGPSMVQGTLDFGGQSIPMGKAVGYGANTFVGAANDLIWSTTGDRFVLTARDTTGTVRREVRMAAPPRAVSDADKEAFKAAMREQFEAAKSFGVPEGMLDAEIAKLDQTTFAEHRPAIGQLTVDRLGRVWVTPDVPTVDDSLRWFVFSSEGELLGRLQLPKGLLVAASEDRVVLRREDDETGLVRLEVWGLNRACDECDSETN